MQKSLEQVHVIQAQDNEIRLTRKILEQANLRLGNQAGPTYWWPKPQSMVPWLLPSVKREHNRLLRNSSCLDNGGNRELHKTEKTPNRIAIAY